MGTSLLHGEEAKPLQIGGYALWGEIASGGMASVHYGRLIGPSGFSRAVAVKRLHRRHAEDNEFVSMFLDEARVAARIRHPNVVATLDVVSSNGELLIVMEYVAGETLARLIGAAVGRGHPMPFPVAASIVEQLLRGLQAAHEARGEDGQALNLVHRDISPQNILVGIDGVARVLDFGVAKAATQVQTTERGRIKGKLGYMAPEQLKGESCDRRADIFAAGIVLWESLTGRRLFRGSDIAEVVHKVTETDVPPPSAVTPSVPVEVEAVVMRALQRDPAERYASAREFADALEAAIESATVSEVADWVSSAGRERLRARAALIASLEARAHRASRPGSVEARTPAVLPPPPLSSLRSAPGSRVLSAAFVPPAPRLPSGPGMTERPFLRRALRAAIVGVVCVALVSGGIFAGFRLARRPTAAFTASERPREAVGFSAPAIAAPAPRSTSTQNPEEDRPDTR